MPAPPLEPAAPDAPAAPDGEAHVDDSQALMHMDEDASNAVVLHEDKIYYPSAAEVYGDDVETLYATIRSDVRHEDVTPIWETEGTSRWFGVWSMGFRDLESPEARAIPGYSEFLNTPLTDQGFFEDPTRAQKLLLVFKRTM